jgi:membrane-associated protease RseP (regulator of RpoE activity)
MSKKLSFTLVLLILAASLAAAEAPNSEGVRRTVIVRDGNVVLDEVEPGGKRAFVGVSLTELTPELREFFGATRDAGVLVSSVSENGPAARAGVRVGDVITAVNGKLIANYWDLRSAIKDNHAGDAIRLDVLRGKGKQTLMATAEERDTPEFRAFNLKGLDKGMIERVFPFPDKEWHGALIAPENQELRSRIRELERRLQELEKRLPK